MTEPEPRNRQALKNECVKTWKMPAEKAPTPQEREKAEMLLREHKNLADKQVKIYEVTNNLYRGKNK